MIQDVGQRFLLHITAGQLTFSILLPHRRRTVLVGSRFNLALIANLYSLKEIYLPLLMNELLAECAETHEKVLPWSGDDFSWLMYALCLCALKSLLISFIFPQPTTFPPPVRVFRSMSMVAEKRRDFRTALHRDLMSAFCPSPGTGGGGGGGGGGIQEILHLNRSSCPPGHLLQ